MAKTMNDLIPGYSPVPAPELAVVRAENPPFVPRDKTEDIVVSGVVLVLAIIAIFVLRIIWKRVRKINVESIARTGVESVARTAGTLTGAAERGFKQGRLGDR